MSKMKNFERVMFVLRGKMPRGERVFGDNHHQTSPFPLQRLVFETIDWTVTITWYPRRYGLYDTMPSYIDFAFNSDPAKPWTIYPSKTLGFWDRRKLCSFTNKCWREIVEEQDRQKAAAKVDRSTIPLRQRPNLTPDEIVDLFFYEQPDDWLADVPVERVEGSM